MSYLDVVFGIAVYGWVGAFVGSLMAPSFDLTVGWGGLFGFFVAFFSALILVNPLFLPPDNKR